MLEARMRHNTFPLRELSAESPGGRRGENPGDRPESGQRNGASGSADSEEHGPDQEAECHGYCRGDERGLTVVVGCRWHRGVSRPGHRTTVAGAGAQAFSSAVMMARVTAPPRWPEARATRGMVAAPHVLASEAGRAMFAADGNALDAAIAAAATIAVVYPHMNSIGGDNFWLIYDARAGRLRALNACGRSAAGGGR